MRAGRVGIGILELRNLLSGLMTNFNLRVCHSHTKVSQAIIQILLDLHVGLKVGDNSLVIGPT